MQGGSRSSLGSDPANSATCNLLFSKALFSGLPNIALALLLQRTYRLRSSLSARTSYAHAGLVLEPVPVGAWAFVMLTFTVATKTLPFLTAFAAFRNEVIWLIVVSFFFAKGFEKCGLGNRIANIFVKLLGSSTLGLSYGLVLAEGLIAPAMPSTSARAGGIFLPIIKSLSESAGSFPGETSKKLGSFLVFTILQVRASANNGVCSEHAIASKQATPPVGTHFADQ